MAAHAPAGSLPVPWAAWVGVTLGALVEVGAVVGAFVGACVGVFVGACVGACVGAFVGACVGAFVGVWQTLVMSFVKSTPPWQVSVGIFR